MNGSWLRYKLKDVKDIKYVTISNYYWEDVWCFWLKDSC